LKIVLSTLLDISVEDSNFVVYERLPFTLNFLGYNTLESKSIIGNRTAAPGNPSMSVGLAIRKAISYAIDRNEINQVLHGGEYKIHDYPLYPHLGKWLFPDIMI
jgi:ABC-type transport system substrate-binding protein